MRNKDTLNNLDNFKNQSASLNTQQFDKSKSNTKETQNIRVLSRTNKSGNVFTMLFVIVAMLVLGVAMGFTYSMLNASKTATGVISFNLPPNVDLANYHLYIENATTYVGKTATAENALTTETQNTFNLVLADASQNGTKSAYVKLELIFIGATSGDFTYSNANTLKFINKNGVESSIILDYSGVTITDDGLTMTFASRGLVPQYASIFLDKVLSGLSAEITTSNRLLKIKASTSYSNDFSSSASSTLYVNYASYKTVVITAPSGTGYTISNVKINGATADLNSVPYGSILAFDVELSAGYDGNAPLVQLKNGATEIATLNPTTTSGTTYSYSTQVTQACAVSVTPTPNTYTITFAGNGSTSGSMSNISCVYGKSYTLTNAFKREYTVTFDSNGGVIDNDKLTSIYTFNGWICSNGQTYSNGASVSNLTTTNGATVTMTAQWTGGSVVLPTPTRGTDLFNGWIVNDVNVGRGGDSYTPTADVELWANWISVSSCCVSGDTLITLADGTTKRADRVEVGDLVMTYNYESGALEASPVLKTISKYRYEQVTINFTDGTSIKITNDHILYTSVGWKAYDINAGNHTYGDSVEVVGQFVKDDALFSTSKYFDKIIAEIIYEEFETAMTFYTFTVEKNHNYFSNDVLSHNGDIACPS